MTDREKQMIEAYIPGERDKTLGFGEFYCKDFSGRVQKVRALTVLPHGEGGVDLIYGCVYASNGNHFTGMWGKEPFDGVARADLYDNKEDCKNDTHGCINDWEKLRKLQEAEG